MFSLEMTYKQIFERIGSDCARVEYIKIRDKTATDEENRRIQKVFDEMYKAKKLTLIDDIYNVEAIIKQIYNLKPDFVIIDYLQFVASTQKTDKTKDKFDYISAQLKQCAKKTNCHIMILSQINRADKAAPTMSSLKESGNLEADGDYIMLLHRPFVLDKTKNYKESTTQLNLDKNKYGRTGIIDLYFDVEFQNLSEVIT